MFIKGIGMFIKGIGMFIKGIGMFTNTIFINYRSFKQKKINESKNLLLSP